MPVDSLIYATSDDDLSKEFVESMSSNLGEDLGHRLWDFNDRGYIVRVEDSNYSYSYLPDNLPHAATVLHVRMNTPYYGPGYERGNWSEIAAVLEFLSHRIPNGRVWYGRDDGDWVSEVTRASLDELWKHWAENGGRPYYRKFR